jgi:hypothetical protein
VVCAPAGGGGEDEDRDADFFFFFFARSTSHDQKIVILDFSAGLGVDADFVV